MIVNAAGTIALSNFRWADAGNLWSYVLGESQAKQNHISDAKWLTLIQGTDDYFAVVHHSEDGRIRLTSHSCRNITEAISSVELQIDDVKPNAVKVAGLRFTGDGSSWSFLPRAYVVRPFETTVLLLLDWTEGVAQIQALSWYIASYDTMYQGILSVTEIPGSSFLIFSMQRDSEPVVYDPATKAIVRKLKLGGASRAPHPFF